ncbi:MAG: hypothetical protein KatS3mg040_1847 [Candidatus Kapaibacterium sp.]|nr:MAG: hypothetical protein KatS3mg040_1847 [Candidatus Kapabacteria bacterium]
MRLGDIAEVRFGIKTGANEFFYLDEEKIRQWGIEPEFLKPVIKSPRECRSIVIKPEDLKYKIFMCHKDKRELQGTAALEYIKWGESQGFHLRPSCRGRQRWWDVGVQLKNSSVDIKYLATKRIASSGTKMFVPTTKTCYESQQTICRPRVAFSKLHGIQASIAVQGRANYGGPYENRDALQM